MLKYCDTCAKRYSFPLTTHFHDDTKCELCGEICNCNESPTSDLLSFLEFLHKDVEKGEEARKLISRFHEVVYEHNKET